MEKIKPSDKTTETTHSLKQLKEHKVNTQILVKNFQSELEREKAKEIG